MYPTQMTKLTIIGPKTKMESVVESLYAQNIYHIVDHKKNEDLDIGSPFESSEKISEMLVQVRSILSYIKQDVRNKAKFDQKNLEKNLNDLLSKVKSLVSENEASNEKISLLKKKKDVIEALEIFDIQAKNIQESKKVEFIIGKIKNLIDLEKEIKNISKNISISIKDNMVAILYKKEDQDKIISNLNLRQFIPHDISTIKNITDSNNKELTNLAKEITIANKSIEKNNSELEKLGTKYTAEMLSVEEYLTEEMTKADAPLSFGATKDAFLIKGFVPTKKLANVKRKIEAITEGKIYFKESKPTKDDKIPVEMDNPKMSKPFEFLMHMFSLPKTNELDPTRLMALTFPIFFGFMLGDFGYGLLLLLFFMFLKKKMPSAKALANILIISAIGTMFFGVMFGEYFGFEEMPESVAHQLENFGITIVPHAAGSHDAHAEEHETEYYEVTEVTKNASEYVHLESASEIELDENGEPIVISSGVVPASEGVEITHIEEVHELIPEHHPELFTEEAEEMVYPTPKLIQRTHQVPDLLSISIMVGVAHLLLGFILGFINIFRDHGLWHAITEKVGWILLIPALLWLLVTINIVTGLIANIVNSILPSQMVIMIMGIIGALLIIIGEGFIGAIELPAILSNTLSYARLMAVGLASVQLALITNTFATDMFHAGGLMILAGISVLLIGHTINILLGLIGPFLHSLRLHYVEFFGKFFKGGGILYKPFGKEADE